MFSLNHYLAYVLQTNCSVGVEGESTTSGVNRWVRFNDCSVEEVADGWFGIVQECLDGRSFPTVLVYEKLSDSSDSGADDR